MAALIFSVLLLVGCTKAPATSTVQIQLPNFNQSASSSTVFSQDVTAFGATPFISRIVINVTGGGISQPIVKYFLSNDPQHPVPTSVAIQVPVGQGRLVQVFAVTKSAWLDVNGALADSGDGTEHFYYGDTTANISGDTSLDLSLGNLNATGGTAGAISGRFLDTSTSGPTGIVDVMFQPPNGRPSMVLATTEIHGGWFEFPAFDSINLTYVSREGRTFFPQTNLATIPPGVTNTNLVAAAPAAYRVVTSAGNELTRVATKPSKLYYGFFASNSVNLSGKYTCYDNSPMNVMGLFAYSVALDQTLVTWPTTNQASVLSGGAAISGGSCSGNYLVDWIKMNPAKMGDYRGNLGFRSPFQVFTSTVGSPTVLEAVPGGSGLTLNWRWLPDVTDATAPDRISGVGVFMRSSSTAFPAVGHKDFEEGELVACNRLTDSNFLAQPFQLVSRVPNAGTGPQTTTISGVSSADFAAGKVQVVLCPYSNGRSYYFRSAAIATGGSGKFPVRLAATWIDGTEATSSGSAKSIHTGVCTPVLIQALQASGQPAQPGPPRAVTVAASSGADLLSQSPDCSGGVNPLTISNLTDHRYVWLNSPRAPGFSGYLTVTDTSASPLASTTFNYSIVAGGTSASQLLTVAPPSAVVGACVDALLVGADAAGIPSTITSGSYYTPSSPQYYQQSDTYCSAGALTGMPTISTTSVPIHIRYTGAAMPSVTISPSPMSPSTAPTARMNFIAGGPTWTTRIWMNPQTSLTGSDNCQQVFVSLADVDGNAIAGTSSSISLTATNGFFYTSNPCSSGSMTTTSVGISGSDYIKNTTLYFKPSSQTGAMVTATMPGMVPHTFTFNVGP